MHNSRPSHLLLCLLLVWECLTLTMTASAQQFSPDSAAAIVNRFLLLSDPSSLHHDSMLVMETIITSPSSSDTTTMRRWFATPQMQRIEVWQGPSLTTALCTNGHDRFREYNPSLGYWVDIPHDQFLDHISGYDCRGSLHGWQASGTRLSYKGPATAKNNQPLEAVAVETPGLYKRLYLFQPSGLLAIIIESDEVVDSSDHRRNTASHIQWKMIHEYHVVGNLYLPRQESFLRQGTLTVLTSQARIEPRRNIIFNQD